jgi:hypothetical protein
MCAIAHKNACAAKKKGSRGEEYERKSLTLQKERKKNERR